MRDALDASDHGHVARGDNKDLSEVEVSQVGLEGHAIIEHVAIVKGLVVFPLDFEVCDARKYGLEVLSDKSDRLDTEEGRVAHSGVELAHAVLGLRMETPVRVLEELSRLLEACHVLHPEVPQVVWHLVYVLNKQLARRLLLSIQDLYLGLLYYLMGYLQLQLE